MNTIFVYGTLLNNEILDIILGHTPEKHTAYLEGYKRVTVLGEKYPAIFPEEGCTVAGALITGLNDADIARLDDYEDICYSRQAVVVTLEDSTPHDCMTYIYRPYYYDDLSDNAWSNNDFREHHLQAFLEALQQFKG